MDMKKDEQTNFQAVTDLVAVHALAQIAWQNSQEEQDDLTVAEHQSDNIEMEEVGGHHSDSSDQMDSLAVNPITFAWRLMKLLKRFFKER